MTSQEAIRILDPETTVEALAEIEYYAGFRGEESVKKAVYDACILAVAALREQEQRRWIPVTDRSPEFGERVMFMKCNQICKWNSNVGCVKPYGAPCILENMPPTDKKATNADRILDMSDEEQED